MDVRLSVGVRMDIQKLTGHVHKEDETTCSKCVDRFRCHYQNNLGDLYDHLIMFMRIIFCLNNEQEFDMGSNHYERRNTYKHDEETASTSHESNHVFRNLHEAGVGLKINDHFTLAYNPSTQIGAGHQGMVLIVATSLAKSTIKVALVGRNH